MKKTLFLIPLLLNGVLWGNEILPSGSPLDPQIFFRTNKTDHYSVTFEQETNRNIVKLLLKSYHKNKRGINENYAPLYVGGCAKFPAQGFQINGSAEYRLLFDYKGKGKNIYVCGDLIDSKGKMSRIKTVSGQLHLPDVWKTKELTFKTAEDSQRVIFTFMFLGNEKDHSLKEKPGDFFVLSNIKLMPLEKKSGATK